MNHDGNANNGDDDETPEEMVNRSLAQAYDNQQRYMELFRHSAHMLHVLSRFMADPIVVHDLEEDVSDSDSSTTESNATISPTTCPVHTSVASTAGPSLNDVPQSMVCDTVESHLNSVRTAQGFNNGMRPQSCRTRPSDQAANRIGWSSDTDSQAARRCIGGMETEHEPGFILRALQRESLQEHVAGSGEGASIGGRPIAYYSSCSPLSTTCNDSTSTSTRQDTDPDTGQSSVNESVACNNHKTHTDSHRVFGSHFNQKPGGEGSKQKSTDSHSYFIGQTIKIPVNSIHQESGDMPIATAHNPASNGTISEERADRFSVGLSTQTSIKNAMSEISKAADTIRQARNMLNSLNLKPGIQINNNNHEPTEHEAESDNEDEGISENCFQSNRATTNVLKFVQPMEPMFGSPINSCVAPETPTRADQERRGSLKPILVKPVAENRISLTVNPITESNGTDDSKTILSQVGNLNGGSNADCGHQERRTVSFATNSNCEDDENCRSVPQNQSEKAMTQNQIRSMIHTRTMVMCGIGSDSRTMGETSDMYGNSSLLSMLHYQNSNTDFGTQTDGNELEQRHIPVPLQLRRKLSPRSFNCSVRISVDTFQQALTQAIQSLEKEGVWRQNKINSEKLTVSKVDNNQFTLQHSCTSPVNEEQSVIQQKSRSTTSVEKLETMQLMQRSNPIDVLQNQNTRNENTTEVIQYEASKHSLVSEKENIVNDEKFVEQSELLQNIPNLTPVKPFTESEEYENDDEVRDVFNRNDCIVQVNRGINENDDFDGLETILLDEFKSPNQTDSNSSYTTTESGSTKWKCLWVDKNDGNEIQNKNLPISNSEKDGILIRKGIDSSMESTDPITLNTNPVDGTKTVAEPISFNMPQCNDGDSVFDSSLSLDKRVQNFQYKSTKTIQEEENDETTVITKEKTSLFKRISSKVKGWFRKNL